MSRCESTMWESRSGRSAPRRPKTVKLLTFVIHHLFPSLFHFGLITRLFDKSPSSSAGGHPPDWFRGISVFFNFYCSLGFLPFWFYSFSIIFFYFFISCRGLSRLLVRFWAHIKHLPVLQYRIVTVTIWLERSVDSLTAVTAHCRKMIIASANTEPQAFARPPSTQ